VARPRPRLGERERAALIAWLRHDSKKAAASELYVTESTISTHIERIRGKYAALGRPATTKAAMLARAVQDGLLDLDDL
jgi:DNA-binding CsgD family transcriptional regulator